MAHPRQELALRFICPDRFRQCFGNQLVLLLDDALSHIGLAYVEFLDVGGKQSHAGRHREEERVADEGWERDRIYQYTDNLIGEEQEYRTHNGVVKFEADHATAVDRANDDAGVVLAV